MIDSGHVLVMGTMMVTTVHRVTAARGANVSGTRFIQSLQLVNDNEIRQGENQHSELWN